ncbi:MAG: hypothetical protein AAGI68_16615 [Planctomycetota bacterium]
MPAAVTPGDTPLPPDRGLGPALLWAAFLGSSWTWVIGMFFPVLLLRDYGPWGWVAFAVPNMVGAAAFGFVLARRRDSELFVQRHAVACQAFSQVTIAFHLFVVTWLVMGLFGPMGLGVLILTLLVGAGYGLRDRNLAMLVVAAVVTLLSLGVFSYVAKLSEGFLFVPPLGPSAGVDGLQLVPRFGMAELLWLVPAMVGGFALCPYLDLTFHRARQATDTPTGKGAFALGFLGVFGTMIFLSLGYAGKLIPVFEDQGVALASKVVLSGVWVGLLAIHIPMQMGFTLVVHGREASDPGSPGARPERVLLAVVIGMGLGIAARVVTEPVLTTADGMGMTLGEAVYRGLLLLYGSVFPAYVLLVATPVRGEVDRRVRLLVFVVTAPLVFGASWVSFVMGVAWWTGVSAGVLVLPWVVMNVVGSRERAEARR